ncbi:MAG: hypothetical protein QXG65_00135 [Thermoplasmata archaeon]
MRLHRGGRFRAWLGRRLGGDAALGDRAWRRILHGLAGASVVYFALPAGALGPVPNAAIPFAALAALALLEGLRLTGRIELPVTRPYEARRPASYAYFGGAIVASALAFPRPIAIAVILGTALVDPIAGELRASPRWSAGYPWLAGAAYGAIALGSLAVAGPVPLLPAAGLAVLAAILALAAEAPTWTYVDDDLAMTLVPGVALTVLALLVPPLLAGVG